MLSLTFTSSMLVNSLQHPISSVAENLSGVRIFIRDPQRDASSIISWMKNDRSDVEGEVNLDWDL